MKGNLADTAPAFELTPTQQLYLMVDGGQIEQLARQLYSLPGELDLEFIYIKEPYDHLLEASPCVIRATEPVKEWFLAQNTPTAGYLFASSEPLDAITEAFRHLIKVESPYGSPVFLKMAQSEAAWVLLDTGSAAFWHRIETAWLPTREGWKTLRRPEGLEPEPTQGLKLTDEQWRRFSEISWRNRLDEVEAHMNQWFPQCLQAAGHGRQWIESNAETAYGKGFTQPQDLLNYFNILGVLGDEAFTDRYPEICDLIENRSERTPSQRIEQAAVLAGRYTHKEMHT